MQLLWILLAAFVASLLASIGAMDDAPLAAGLMVGASFYLVGFTGLAITGAFDAGLRSRKIFGSVMLFLGSTSVASSLLITAVKVYAKYFPV